MNGISGKWCNRKSINWVKIYECVWINRIIVKCRGEQWCMYSGGKNITVDNIGIGVTQEKIK